MFSLRGFFKMFGSYYSSSSVVIGITRGKVLEVGLGTSQALILET